MPIDYSQYPANWKSEIRPAILTRAGHCCEGSPAYPDCRVKNYSKHPLTGSKVILTIAHVNHDIEDNDYNNLRAWCQLCHNTHDAQKRAGTRYRKRWEHKNQLKLWDMQNELS